AAVEAKLAVGRFDSLSQLVSVVGLAISENAAGTMGLLLARAFIDSGRELDGAGSSLDSASIVRFLEEAASSVSRRGSVVAGQRTVLDAMDGAATAAKDSASRGATPIETLERAACGAEAGAN